MKQKNDSFSLLCSCFSANSNVVVGRTSSKRGSNILKDMNKSPVVFLLEDFWRFGIPGTLRKALWPFAIQNKLGLSK